MQIFLVMARLPNVIENVDTWKLFNIRETRWPGNWWHRKVDKQVLTQDRKIYKVSVLELSMMCVFSSIWWPRTKHLSQFIHEHISGWPSVNRCQSPSRCAVCLCVRFWCLLPCLIVIRSGFCVTTPEHDSGLNPRHVTVIGNSRNSH